MNAPALNACPPEVSMTRSIYYAAAMLCTAFLIGILLATGVPA